MSTELVSITGLGVISPWGIGTSEFASGLTERRSMLATGRPAPRGSEPSVPAAEVRDFEPANLLPKMKGLREFDRTSLLLAGAAALALGDDLSFCVGDDTGLAVGSTFGTISSIEEFDVQALVESPLYVSPTAFPNTVLNAPAGRVARLFGLRGVNATISTGETSGLDSLIYATEWLQAGRARGLLVGGAFGLSPMLRETFTQPLGEGAAAFVMRSDLGSGGRAYATVAGFETAFLAAPLDPLPLATGAIERCLASARICPADVDLLICCGRSPRGWPDLEREALERAFNGSPPAVWSFADLIGDCLDASSAFQVTAALLAIERGAGAVLVSALSRSGNSSFVALAAPGATS
jgi:3-oxoacyl-[acyl-carrier-protein] synthase II